MILSGVQDGNCIHHFCLSFPLLSPSFASDYQLAFASSECYLLYVNSGKLSCSIFIFMLYVNGAVFPFTFVENSMNHDVKVKT